MILNTKFYKITASFIILTSLLSCDLNETQTVTTKNTLVWQDQFLVDGFIDSNKWSYEIGDGSAQGIPGWGNNELQYYTDRQTNVEVKNGMLYITAKKESYMGSDYTSARIVTKGKFQQKYGRFEARIKLPLGQGFWPAFWMLGDDNNGAISWPERGEIDIMENRGSEPTMVHGTIHGPGYSGGNAVTKSYDLVNQRVDTDFHIYGVEWGPNYINYYVDNVLYNQLTPKDIPAGSQWVFNDRPFYIILNLAVGGSFAGNPTLNTTFPQAMIVDYVKVYQ